MKNTFLCHSEHKMCISLHQRTLCDILMLVFRHNKCVKYKIFIGRFKAHYKNSPQRDNRAIYSALIALLSAQQEPYNLHESEVR